MTTNKCRRNDRKKITIFNHHISKTEARLIKWMLKLLGEGYKKIFISSQSIAAKITYYFK